MEDRKMLAIQERANKYVQDNFGSDMPEIKDAVMETYLAACQDVLDDLKRTISCSKEGWLEKNLQTLIKQLG